MPYATSAGLSFMAVSTTGKVIGVVMNGSHEAGHLDEMQRSADSCSNPRFRKILQLLLTVERRSEVFSKFPDTDRQFEVRILSVDSAMRGRGVAKALLQKSRFVTSKVYLNCCFHSFPVFSCLPLSPLLLCSFLCLYFPLFLPVLPCLLSLIFASFLSYFLSLALFSFVYYFLYFHIFISPFSFLLLFSFSLSLCVCSFLYYSLHSCLSSFPFCIPILISCSLCLPVFPFLHFSSFPFILPFHLFLMSFVPSSL